MKNRSNFLAFFLLVLSMPVSVSASSITLYAAGSLKAALGEVVASYQHSYQTEVVSQFAPSGLLRKAIEGGDSPDVFASANMAHPQKLAASGWGAPVVLFARNRLCALVQPDVEVTSGTLLNNLLDNRTRVATSTPTADPSGDYAWALFARAEGIRAGSFEILSGKALQLTGGADSEQAPAGRNPYGWVMSENKADVFLTYCTNAVLARNEVPGLQVISIPAALSVGADYGLLVKQGAPAGAWQLAMYILSPEGQKILSHYGFEAAAMPIK